MSCSAILKITGAHQTWVALKRGWQKGKTSCESQHLKNSPDALDAVTVREPTRWEKLFTLCKRFSVFFSSQQNLAKSTCGFHTFKLGWRTPKCSLCINSHFKAKSFIAGSIQSPKKKKSSARNHYFPLAMWKSILHRWAKGNKEECTSETHSNGGPGGQFANLSKRPFLQFPTSLVGVFLNSNWRAISSK